MQHYQLFTKEREAWMVATGEPQKLLLQVLDQQWLKCKEFEFELNQKKKFEVE